MFRTLSGRSPKAFLILALALLCAHCAPERARAMREDKAFSLGAPIVFSAALSYRPTGKFGVGLAGSALNDRKSTIDASKTGIAAVSVSNDTAETDKRELSTSSYEINPFVQIFPWDSSAFFLGVAGAYRNARYRYQEETEASTTLAPAYTAIKYETTSSYVGVPVGWAWIWGSGFSLSFDFGPRFRVNKEQDLANDGATSGVSTTKRDHTIGIIDDLEPKVAWGGSSLIGWSF